MSTKPKSLRLHTWQGSWGLLATLFVLALSLVPQPGSHTWRGGTTQSLRCTHRQSDRLREF